MTLRSARLAAPTIRAAYDEAMEKVKARRPLPIVGLATAPTAVPDRVEWLRSEMLKTRVAHGYGSRHLAAEARGWDSEVARHARVIASIEAQVAELSEAVGK